MLKTKICPKCKSTQIELVAGGGIGLYECSKCKFRSAIFPEKEIDTEEVKNKNENL